MKSLVSQENVNKLQAGIGHTPLVHAIQKGKFEIAKYLVESGADVNEVNVIGMTPLLAAVDFKNVEIARYLVESGADINAKEKANGHTPLMRAVISGNYDMVYYLASAGADLNEKDNSGRTALDVAKMWGTEVISSYLAGKPNEEKSR